MEGAVCEFRKELNPFEFRRILGKPAVLADSEFFRERGVALQNGELLLRVVKKRFADGKIRRGVQGVDGGQIFGNRPFDESDDVFFAVRLIRQAKVGEIDDEISHGLFKEEVEMDHLLEIQVIGEIG